jgi:hypothetical protein
MVNFHQDETIFTAVELSAWRETTFFKAFLSPYVPFQSLQVNPFDSGLREDIGNCRGKCISSVALVPVVPVCDHDTYFCFALVQVYIEAAKVADMFSIKRFNGEAQGSIRLARLFSVQFKELLKCARYWVGSIEATELTILAPLIIIKRIVYVFRAQYSFFSG